MSFTPAIPSLSAPMGASPKPTLVLDLEGVAGEEVKLHQWLEANNGSYYDFAIDWGDGTVEKVNEDNFKTISHTYSAPAGSVRARIVGKFELARGDRNWGKISDFGIRDYTTEISVENESPLKNTRGCFNHFTKLICIDKKLFENYRATGEVWSTFQECLILPDIPREFFDAAHLSTTYQTTFFDSPALKAAPLNVWGVQRFSGSIGSTVNSPFNNSNGNLKIVYLKNVCGAAQLTQFFNESGLPNRTGKEAGKLYLMATPGYEDKALLTPTQEHIDAAAALNWVFADPAELSQE